MNKYFDLDSREKLLEIINELGSFPMQKYSHGYEKYKNKTVKEAADLGAEEFLSGLGMKNAAITLMSVVLVFMSSWMAKQLLKMASFLKLPNQLSAGALSQ